MFRIITYITDHLSKNGTPVDDELVFELKFQGFDRNDPLEGHMARSRVRTQKTHLLSGAD